MLQRIANVFIHSVLRRFSPGLRYITKESDVDFILALMIEGAREEHFHPSFQDVRQQEAFRGELYRIAKHNEMFRITDNRGIEAVGATGYLFGTKKTNYGFVILAEKEPDSQEQELYFGSIAKEYRDRGYCTKMHDHLFRLIPSELTYFVRCYPNSKVMCQFLLKRGFKHIETSATGIRYLERCPE